MKMSAASVVVGLLASAASATIPFTGTYTQDFNGLGQSGTALVPERGPHALNGILGSTGVDGWYGWNYAGSSGNAEFKAHNGGLSGNAGRGVVFFGADGSSERALGALPTSNQVSAFGALFTNTTNDTFASVTIRYTGEQWRAGSANLLNTLAFSWGLASGINDDGLVAETALDFVTPVLTGGEIAVDGNSDPYRTAILYTISGVNWAPGQTLAIRWSISDLTGQDNGLAIDDFGMVGIIPAPASALALAGLAAFARRRRA